MPNSVYDVKEIAVAENVEWPDAPLNYYHCFSNRKSKDGDYITSRMKFMANPHCIISTATPNKQTDDFFKNAYANEYIFVHYGNPLFSVRIWQDPARAGRSADHPQRDTVSVQVLPI